MHEDLPSDPDELRIVESHLLRQLARAREQLDSTAPLYRDLPADPRRLRVLEAHITGQLRRVWENLYELETGDEPWASGPAPGWRLQHLPTAVNHAPRQVLHREDCWIDSGDALSAAEAADYANRPNVERCALCHPSARVGSLPSHVTGAAASS